MSTGQRPVVWITGAAGGLGQALVAEFRVRNYTVAASFHRTPFNSADEEVLRLQCDVTDRSQVRAAVDAIAGRFGGIDVLVNNAGLTADNRIGQLENEDWDQVLDVNLKGAFQCSQAVISSMQKRRTGNIINIGSYAAKSGAAGQCAYAAAKAGLIGLTQSIAREAGSSNVRANVVLPGVMPTPMTASLSAEIMTGFARANALGRINDPGEVARFVVHLAGMKNVSGQIFQLDSRIGAWT